MIISKEDFIEIKNFIDKVEKCRGYVDHIDAYRLISHYVDVFGVKYMNKLSIEDELILYYDELKSFVNKSNVNNYISIYYKKCNRCNEVKNKSEYSIRRGTQDGLCYQCKDCDKVVIQQKKIN